MPIKKQKTAHDIVDSCNALARLFYKQNGYHVEDGYRFDQATHPQERGMWNMASAAYYFIEGTDCDCALDEVEEGEYEQDN